VDFVKSAAILSSQVSHFWHWRWWKPNFLSRLCPRNVSRHPRNGP